MLNAKTLSFVQQHNGLKMQTFPLCLTKYKTKFLIKWNDQKRINLFQDSESNNVLSSANEYIYMRSDGKFVGKGFEMIKKF